MTRRAAFVLLALLALLAVFAAAPARALRLEEEEALSLGEFDLEQQDAALVASLAEVDAEADAELDLEADAEMEAEAEAELEAEAEAEVETFAPNTIARGKACGTGNKGTCVVSSSCSTNTHERVWNLCVIGNVCCVPKAGSSAAAAKAPAAPAAAAAKAPAAPAAPAAVATGANGLCGDYASAAVMQRTNNRGQKVNVVAVKREHLTDASKFGAADTAADNTMLTTTACAYSKLRAAAAQAGHTISINSAFRSLARQQYFWSCYQCKLAKKKNCCNNGNKAAQPGTSNHGMGIALDLQLTTAAYNWMRTNAEKYGFVRTVATEKWHWENRPGTKQSAFFKI